MTRLIRVFCKNLPDRSGCFSLVLLPVKVTRLVPGDLTLTLTRVMVLTTACMSLTQGILSGMCSMTACILITLTPMGSRMYHFPGGILSSKLSLPDLIRLILRWVLTRVDKFRGKAGSVILQNMCRPLKLQLYLSRVMLMFLLTGRE